MRIAAFLILLSFHTLTTAQGLQDAKSWEYQLQNIDPFEIENSEADIAVIDYTRNGDPVFQFNRREIQRMQRKSNGAKRLLFCYISIGEAEAYRPYWKNKWKRNPPEWLHLENPDWPGNYKVYFWHPQWQSLIYRYLDKIISLGFDGVYLDLVDGYEYFQDSIPDSDLRMIHWVASIKSYCLSKTKSPFYIIAQNAETLTEHREYLSLIDGIAKEELFYGYNGPEQLNPAEETAYSLKHLKLAQSSGKKILVVEYLRDSLNILHAKSKCEETNLLFLQANRALDRINGLPVHLDSAQIERITPGQFYSLTLPNRNIRIVNTLEHYAEKLNYYRPLTADDDIEFQAPHFFEATNLFSLSRGCRKNWEAGITIPFRYYEIEPDKSDSLWNTSEKRLGTGPGNLRLALYKGFSKNDFHDNLLFELQLEFPTDARKGAISPGLSNYLGGTAEHYRANFGIFGYAGLNFYTNNSYGDWWLVPEFRFGSGAQLLRRLFVSALIAEEGKIFRTECSSEFLFSAYFSLDISGGKDITGTTGGYYGSISMNKIFRMKAKSKFKK